MKRRAILVTMGGALALAACNSDIEQNSGSGTTPLNQGEVADTDELVSPVVIGESGPRFDACQATGIVRSASSDGRLPVRAAPFTDAAERDALAAGDAVFVCTRSHDQSWFGIVYSDSRDLGSPCGVSAPIPSRRAYDGPCSSGWVSSAFIQLRAR